MAEANGAQRPSPDALLELAKKEETSRGKLKIFLGAAPGVGKTYEMLLSGRAQSAAGVDVVVGVVETHGRAETEALLAGLEIIPRRKIDYRGRVIEEMDLQALLARKPKLALVDELAHTNAPGSQHPKRYLDVEALLDAGIDVYTTLNIQHVESLNDVVAQITRIRVRETVPDSILDRADDIELVDLTPTALIQRLREGKVYVPKQAERALRHYFSPGNLTALRELALRRTAERVDEQLLSHMQAHAISGPWPAGERVLVCISEDPRAAGLIRYTKRLADRLRAPWKALYIETARSHDLSVVERDRVADTLRLAERLGGTTATIPGGNNIADEILSFARANNITQIVLGKSRRSRWFELIYGSVVYDLLRRSCPISLHVIASDAITEAPIPKKTVETAADRAIPFLGYGAALLITALALGVALLLQPHFGSEPVPLVFLMGVIATAYSWGLGPSLLAAFASMLGYNFFFLPPIYTFTIADPANVAALFFFLFAAIAVSNLTARVSSQARVARSRAATTEALYTFSKNLAGIATLDDVLWAAASQIGNSLKADVAILLPNKDNRLDLAATFPAGETLNDAEMGAATWSFGNNRASGRGADTLPGVERLFLPLRTGRGVIGVIGLGAGRRPDIILTPDERRLLDALMDQTAVAIERVRLASEMDEARVAAAAEKLRGALLTSLSHDLKTPLASIVGAATSLREYSSLFDEAARGELVKTIEEESERLYRFVVNLLDMTRLEAGAIDLRREPADLSEIIATAIHRLKRSLADFEVELEIEPDLPMLDLDVLLTEQVLINILDNATHHAPKGSKIRIRAEKTPGAIALQIMDEGTGIPPDSLDKIFDKFQRVKNGDRQRAGTGLGLAICKGFVEAMGGTITAGNRNDGRGAVFTVSFPLLRAARGKELPAQ